MSEDQKARTAKSVRDRLLVLSRSRGEDFNLVLTRYALERFLDRLSRSEHRSHLILKGALLFQVWSSTPHRATRDLDLLVEGEVNAAVLERKLKEICQVQAPEDGLSFDLSELDVREIREESRYGGLRTRFRATLGSAKIAIQIDFGVGDAVTPGPVDVDYPTLLDGEMPRILSYPRETVIAEKLEAIVDLGLDNSRMKDYFDLWFMVTTYQDNLETIAKAVRRTFKRRGQPVPISLPVGLSDEFAKDAEKRAQWKAFQQRSIGTSLTLEEVVTVVRDFALPIFRLAA